MYDPSRVPGTTSAAGADDQALLGLDNVRLELPIAGAGSRTLAAFLDYLLVAVASLAWFAAWGATTTWLGLGFGWMAAGALLGWFLIDYGYFAGVEVATRGRTFGKWALDLRVVTRHGGQPATSALLARNVMRTADLLAGIPLMTIDPLARRLGDRLAGTLVVHGRSRASELLLRQIPRGWGAQEVALLEGFLQREAELDPHRRHRIAGGILKLIERDDPALLSGLPRGDDHVLTLRRAVGFEDR